MMNAVKISKKSKPGKSGEPVRHDSMESSPHIPGISPTANGSLNSFYSAGPVLSLKRYIQPKLTIGQPDDPYEREADRVADQVMSMPEPRLQRNAGCPEGEEEKEQIQTKPLAEQITPIVQRQGQEEEEEEPIQAKPISGNPFQAPPGLPNRIQSLNGGGQPLPKSVRNFFEPRFDADFSQVRVHTDNKADEAANSVKAKAFTKGRDVVFAAGQYSPGEPAGKNLLAHELSHVVQQKGNRESDHIRRWAISNCTYVQGEVYITDAIARAFDDLFDALEMFGTQPDRVKNALWLAFRSDSPNTVKKVKKNIQTLKNKITSAKFECRDRADEPGCDDKTYAMAPRGNPGGTITICRPKFFEKDMNLYAQSTAVIHEAAHMYLSMKDHGYFSFPLNLCKEGEHPKGKFDPGHKESGTAGDNPKYRLDNADSYCCFVYYLKYSKGREMSGIAAGYRGDNLKITSTDQSSNIYTRQGISLHNLFKIEGVPENSGFLFRWKIIAGNGDEYYPSSRDFDESEKEIWIKPARVKELVDQGFRRVKLVCEIQLYRAGKSIHPPVILKDVTLNVKDYDPDAMPGTQGT